MGRRRDHFPRFTNHCPDPQACERLYHGTLELKDICECCGKEIEEADEQKEENK